MDKQKRHAEALDVRIQELNKTISTDQAEIKTLRGKLRISEHERVQLATKQEEAAGFKKVLQALDSKRKEEIRERERDIASLEKYLASEKERRELVEARTQSSLVHLESHNEELETQLKQCQSMLARVAEQYGLLASTTVPLSTHSRIKYERSAFEMRVFRLECKLANAEGQVVELVNLVRHAKEENILLAARLKDTEEEAMFYSLALDDAKSTRNDTSYLPFGRTAQDDLAVITKDVDDFQRDIQELRAVEGENAFKIYSLICDELWKHYAILDKALQEKEDLVRKYAADLNVASTIQSTLTSQLKGMQEEQEERQKNVETLKVNSETADRRIEEMETKMLADTSRWEEMLTKERDVVERLTLTVQKSRMAEEGLRAEIHQ